MGGKINAFLFLCVGFHAVTLSEPGKGSSSKNEVPQHDSESNKPVPKQVLENWASNFGGQMFQFGVSVTKYNELQNRFNTAEGVRVEQINLASLITDMVNNINTNLNDKVQAVRKIVNWAEEKALEFYEKPQSSRPPPPGTYFNSKKFTNEKTEPEKLRHKVNLTYDQHFDNIVNVSFSAVHVPTSIYERKDDVIESIGWSKSMDETFLSNYEHNPTLSYQYFGSSTGFLRHYPAMKWPNDNSNKQDPDLYDCRTRPWYVQAANTPKNMFILHDVSGSMTGIRREIAKHVVNTLLDTLTENDYVNVYNFSDTTTPVVPCFKNRLVQANLENVRELKVGLEQDHTAGIANFTSALNMAFNVLEMARTQQDSSNCNQAIMIVTDGAPFYFEEIFKARQNQEQYVRVFTYLIGREVTEKREVLWMACANKGFFTHVSTLSEVQEKVLKYMPVMSRPMVMYRNHVEAWTPVYAHIANTQETDWSWLDHNARAQFNRSIRYKELLRVIREEPNPFLLDHEDAISDSEYQERVRAFMGSQSAEYRKPAFLKENLMPVPSAFTKLTNTSSAGPKALAISAKNLETRLKTVHDHKEEHFPTPVRPKDPTEPFQFIISASSPVFDNRNSTITYETVRVNASFSFKKPVEERIAIFLGVAGTDIPIKELKKMASPFKLGVNGYAFMVNNNGYVVFHPEWRPVFNGQLLKPNYNTVDLTEVELVDRDDNFRNNDSVLLEMRRDMIEEDRAYKKGLRVRVPQDNFTDGSNVYDDGVVEEEEYVPSYKLRVRKIQDYFRRVTLRRQVYEFHKLKNTPYTLAITTPENANRFVGQMEINLAKTQENILGYFDRPDEPRKWKINPDWSYCDFVKGGEKKKFNTAEDQFLYFLGKMLNNSGSWPWKNTGEGIKQRHGGHNQHRQDVWRSAEREVYKYLDDLEQVVLMFFEDDRLALCDKELVQSLVFDANVTQIFSEMILWKFNKNDKNLLKMNGVASAFIATRTGLTRWMDFETDNDDPGATKKESSSDTKKFVEGNNGATNELWYRRAVERYEHDPESFVYSVPFDAGTRNTSRVTATRAIFVNKHGKHAPVAVVGVQFSHRKWMDRFMETTRMSTGGRPASGDTNKWMCGSGKHVCFVLDDNGFIMISEKEEETGKFFGEVDGMVMEMLVHSEVYNRVRVVDYQAVCFQPVSTTNFANILRNPITHIGNLLTWVFAQVSYLLLNFNLALPDIYGAFASLVSEETSQVVENEEGYTLPPYIDLASINKTRLRPCDKETFLYTYGKAYNSHNFSYHGLLTKCGPQLCDGFFNVHYIPHTNLILVVTGGHCRCNLNSTTISQREVTYSTTTTTTTSSSNKKTSKSSNIPPPKQEPEMDEDDELLSGSPIEVCRTPRPSLHRKRPAVCVNYHAEEGYLHEDCGGSPPHVTVTYSVLVGLLVFLQVL